MERFIVKIGQDVLINLGRKRAENEATVLLHENIREAGEDIEKYEITCSIDVRTEQLVCNADKIN
ncbi:hypothetical protein [Paenibacillus chitinolyticus]|uniref:hypothetical protein n=1 Tax=Paenibacillus chitinolyticus TaxID=79263 RepID=UPI0036701745